MSHLGEYVKKALNSGQFKMKDGEIELLEFRLAMLPAYTWTKLIEGMYEKNGEEAFELLLEVGKQHGEYAIDQFGKRHNIPKRQFLDQAMDSVNILGIGEFSLEKFNPQSGEVVYRIENSPFPEQFHESEILSELDRSIDFIQLGMCHSVTEAILDQEVESKEVKCEFQGDSHCEIVVRTKNQ